jgi:hypothetical protein
MISQISQRFDIGVCKFAHPLLSPNVKSLCFLNFHKAVSLCQQKSSLHHKGVQICTPLSLI